MATVVVTVCFYCRSWEEGQPPFNRTLDHNIVVPYPVRSDLSGVLREVSLTCLSAPVIAAPSV